MRGWLREAAGGLPRQFWFLWTGTLINRLGSFVVLFLSIYLTGDRHFTQSQAGIVLGLYGVGGAIGTMTGGVLADRWGRRPTMLTAQFGAAALMLTLGFAETYAQIAVVTLLLGMFYMNSSTLGTRGRSLLAIVVYAVSAAIVWIASISRSGRVRFSRNPDAPALRAPNT